MIRHRPVVSFLKLSLLLACCAAIPLTAQAPFGVPLSDHVVSVDITVDRAPTATLEVREGALGAITLRANKTIAIAPALSDDRSQVDFLVVELTDNGATVNQLDLISLDMKAIQSIKYKGHQITFQPQGVSQRSFATNAPERALDYRPSELRKSFGRAGGSECCVSCGELSMCATRASLPCGSCEVPI